MGTVSIACSSELGGSAREQAKGEATSVVAQFTSLHGEPQLSSRKEKRFNPKRAVPGWLQT